MSESNAPESVDLDESYNSIDPDLLQGILIRNMTVTSRSLMQKSARSLMPIMTAKILGVPMVEEDYQKALLDAYKTISIILDLTYLIDEIVPIDDAELSEERKAEIKKMISTHPIVQKALKAVTETIEEKTSRRHGQF